MLVTFIQGYTEREITTDKEGPGMTHRDWRQRPSSCREKGSPIIQLTSIRRKSAPAAGKPTSIELNSKVAAPHSFSVKLLPENLLQVNVFPANDSKLAKKSPGKRMKKVNNSDREMNNMDSSVKDRSPSGHRDKSRTKGRLSLPDTRLKVGGILF